MPPEDRRRRELEEPDEISRRAGYGRVRGRGLCLERRAQAGKEFGRQNHAREEPERPDQGGRARDVISTSGTRSEPSRLESSVTIVRMARWRRLGLADDGGKTANADGMSQSREQRRQSRLRRGSAESDQGSRPAVSVDRFPSVGLRVARGDGVARMRHGHGSGWLCLVACGRAQNRFLRAGISAAGKKPEANGSSAVIRGGVNSFSFQRV